MNKTTKSRMLAPDILKIFATIFVVVIHHKSKVEPDFVWQYKTTHILVLGICFALGLYLFAKDIVRGKTSLKALLSLSLPLLAWLGFAFLKRVPVAMFLVLSSYFMSGSFLGKENAFVNWYEKGNIISRIARFYVPFAPIFLVGLIYKIVVLHYDYSIIEVVARFFLGGFKPGSYYITILALLVLFFPFVYYIVEKYKFSGVILCGFFSLAYDCAFSYLGWSDVAYKFLIFRFTTHIALGVYMRITNLKWKTPEAICSFVFGGIFAFLCIWTKIYRPSLFFQWKDASFPVAFFVYPIIAWFMSVFKNAEYNDSRISTFVSELSKATYHIFLVQLLYYTTFGFVLNERIDNYFISLPLNLIVTIFLGMGYYKLICKPENAVVSKIKLLFTKNTKLR